MLQARKEISRRCSEHRASFIKGTKAQVTLSGALPWAQGIGAGLIFWTWSREAPILQKKDPQEPWGAEPSPRLCWLQAPSEEQEGFGLSCDHPARQE